MLNKRLYREWDNERRKLPKPLTYENTADHHRQFSWQGVNVPFFVHPHSNKFMMWRFLNCQPSAPFSQRFLLSSASAPFSIIIQRQLQGRTIGCVLTLSSQSLVNIHRDINSAHISQAPNQAISFIKNIKYFITFFILSWALKLHPFLHVCWRLKMYHKLYDFINHNRHISDWWLLIVRRWETNARQ